MRLALIREMRLRALLGQLPRAEDLVELLEDVEDAIRMAEIDDSSELWSAVEAKEETALAEPTTERISEIARAAGAIGVERDRVYRQTPDIIVPTYEVPNAPNLVRVTFGAKDARRAIELYKEADTYDMDPTTFDHAERLYREAIRLDPSLSIARTNLGNVLYRKGRIEEAVRHYREALQIDPEQPEALYNLGVHQIDHGEPTRAIPFLEQAIAACQGEENEQRTLADAHYHLAMILDDVGDVENARPHWKRHLELDPRGPWAEKAREFLRMTETEKPSLKAIRGGKEKR
jgi:tetratricopeptide (TPR) repeat protein